MVGAVALAIPLGVLAAVYRGTIVDRISGAVAVLGIATPSFWLGIVLIYVFSIKLGLLPSSRMDGSRYHHPPCIQLSAMMVVESSQGRPARLLDDGLPAGSN